MLPDKKIKCHETAFTKTCFDMVTKCHCQKYIHIVGIDRNTGQPIDQYGCVDKFLHLIAMENTQMVRELGAAIEGMRNETARAADTTMEMAAKAGMIGEAIQQTNTRMLNISPVNGQRQLPFEESP